MADAERKEAVQLPETREIGNEEELHVYNCENGVYLVVKTPDHETDTFYHMSPFDIARGISGLRSLVGKKMDINIIKEEGRNMGVLIMTKEKRSTSNP